MFVVVVSVGPSVRIVHGTAAAAAKAAAAKADAAATHPPVQDAIVDPSIGEEDEDEEETT
jgi:hypothetical protein